MLHRTYGEADVYEIPDGREAMKIPGSMRVACTPDFRREIKNVGSNTCFLMLDEIKSIPGVKDAWFTRNNKEFDIIVELELDNPEQFHEIESKLKSLDGIQAVKGYIAIEA